MKTLSVLCLSVLLATPALAQALVPPTNITLEFTAQEIDAQVRLNSTACKAAGQDDGGQVCDAAKFLNAKMVEAVKKATAAAAAKPAPVPPAADPAAQPVPKK